MPRSTSPNPPPTKEQLQKAVRKRVPDLIGPKLSVVFCGINPGLYSAAVGHHFAGPGSRFWQTLHKAGFTPRLYSALESAELFAQGFGLTNLVARPTTTADALTADELRRGARALKKKLIEHQPRYLAMLGFVAYRTAFQRRKAVGGLQPDTIGSTKIWVLPNPSGLNAHHRDASLVELFAAFRAVALPSRK